MDSTMPGVNTAISEGIAKFQDALDAPLQATPFVALWDSEWNRKFVVASGWRIDEPDVVAVPLSSPVARWLLDLDHATFESAVHLTAESGGKRWSGRLDRFNVIADDDFSGKFVQARFVSDELPVIDWNAVQP